MGTKKKGGVRIQVDLNIDLILVQLERTERMAWGKRIFGIIFGMNFGILGYSIRGLRVNYLGFPINQCIKHFAAYLLLGRP